MRLCKKYKLFSKHKTLLRSTPIIRICNFKRTKWLAIQKSFLYIFKRNTDQLRAKTFHNNLIFSLPLFRYQRLARFFFEGIFLKRILNSFFDNRLSTYNYKKLLNVSNTYLTYEESYLLVIIKPFFFFDILLWKLGLFSSCYEALQFIQAGNLLLNNKTAFYSTLLKKEDVISFKCSVKKFDITPKAFLLSLVEVDLYSQQIVLLKDFTCITSLDTSLLVPEALEINAFLNYIANK